MTASARPSRWTFSASCGGGRAGTSRRPTVTGKRWPFSVRSRSGEVRHARSPTSVPCCIGSAAIGGPLISASKPVLCSASLVTGMLRRGHSTYLGITLCAQGRYQEAAARHQRALAMFRELGDRPNQVRALNGLGTVLSLLGRSSQARTHHRGALSLACQIGDPYLEARSHSGLADTYHATGDLDQARQHWELVLTCYAEAGVPEAERARAKLSALNGPPHGPGIAGR